MSKLRALLKTRRFWIGAIAAIVLLVVLFDRDSIIERARIKEHIEALESQRDYLQGRISADSALLENLNDDRFLEEYAREHFRMRRPGETLYLIDTTRTRPTSVSPPP